MNTSNARGLRLLYLIAKAIGLAYIGRLGLNQLSDLAPDWAGPIERFGGWAIGMTIGVLVVIPMYKMYGVIPDDIIDVKDNEPERGS
jgi:hypothetical protein